MNIVDYIAAVTNDRAVTLLSA